MLKFWRPAVIRFGGWFLAVKVKSVFIMELHIACRNKPYVVPGSESVPRFHVPDERVSWLEPWTSYRPPIFTVPGLDMQPWADPDIGATGFHPHWNRNDNGIQRESLVRWYDVRKGFPLNPCGRTGLAGRGRLGRWGPNHAVDAVVTRWKRSVSGEKIINVETNRPIVQFISIQRRDTGDWAIPGGMVEQWELSIDAVKREFLEEALNIPEVPEFLNTELGKKLNEFFERGQVVYKGYVDDPRNTDNAWMETTAYLFHDDDDAIVSLLEIEGGDDASKAQWVDVSKELSLYASHSQIIREVISMLVAHW